MTTAPPFFPANIVRIFIGEEEKLHEQNEARGWRGYKSLELIKKEAAAEGIVTLTFKTDVVVTFEPGQYLSLRVSIQNDDWLFGADEQTRSYTVTGVPGKLELQCTVKRITGGLVSEYLHDDLRVGDYLPVAIPMGCMCVVKDTPHVLLSAGVGVTSSWAAYQAAYRVLLFAHVDHSKKAHAFRKQIPAELQLNIYSSVRGGRTDCSTFVNEVMEKVMKQNLPDGKVVFRVCGPPEWMAGVVGSLKVHHRIPSDAIKIEWYGIKQTLKCVAGGK